MGRIKIDWSKAFQEYLLNERMSLKEISDKYGISLSRVKKVSMNQKWKQTKDRIWSNARMAIINETGDNAEEMIKRQKVISIYLQETGMRLLKHYLRTTKVKDINVNAMIKMLFLGLKTERELYPRDLIDREFRQMIQGEEINEQEYSMELKAAIDESFEKDYLLKLKR
jgi:hypothetical protein